MFLNRDLRGSRKPAEYAAARRLRAERGLPFRQIAEELGVSAATVHAWTSDVVVSPDAVRARRVQTDEAVKARAASWAQRSRARRLVWQDEGRARARQRDPDHIAACMLYWAEGSKSRNVAGMANSDPHLLKMFRQFVSREFSRPVESFALRLNVYLGNGVELTEIESYWLAHLDLPQSVLRAHVIDRHPTSSGGGRTNKLPYGCGHLRVLRSTPVVQHIYGAIQEFGGFNEPEWID